MMRIILYSLVATFFLLSCKKDVPVEPVPVPDTSVRFDISQVPYQNLSDYRFFTGTLKDLQPNEGVIQYEPITPLFSDYAHKSRFIWMMPDSSATYVSDSTLLDFPNGTVLIKNFYYDNVQPLMNRRILETRLLIRKNNQWIFADYIWNEDQTEAHYSLQGSFQQIDWIHDDGSSKSVNFRIPSQAECFTCHKANSQNIALAPKPQNLNKTFNYPEGPMNQLQKLQEVGYLTGNLPSNIVSIVDWTDDTQPLDLRIRSYLDANCANCHSDEGHCYYRPIRLAFTKTDDPTMMGICVTPQQMISPQLTHIIARGNINRSVMYFRMNSTDPAFMMPLMGRSLIHQEAVDLMEQYITSLSPICN